MINLLKAELIKLSNKKGFWIILGLYGLITYLAMNIIGNITINEMKVKYLLDYGFPGIWTVLTFVGSQGTLLISILIVMVVSDEFQFKTLRQSIIDGLDIREAVLSKVLVIFLVTLLLVVIFTVVGFIIGAENNVSESASAIGGYQHMFYFFLNILGLLNFSMLITIIVRNTAFSILTIIFYYLIESFIGAQYPDIFSYFPVNSFSSLIRAPEVLSKAGPVEMTDILLAIFWTAFSIAASYIILKKRDN